MAPYLRWISIRGLMVASAVVLLWIPPVWGGPAKGGPVKVGQTAPDFSLPNLSGEKVSLQDFTGQLVLLDFWATWCLPCRKSLPELAALEKKYRDRGVVVLGLAVDDPDSYDDPYIRKFIENYDIEYTILRADPSIVEQYLGKDDPSVPTLFIIDGKGRVLEKHEGVTPGWLEPKLQQYLE